VTDSSGDRNPVELLAEEFIARKRRGSVSASRLPTTMGWTTKALGTIGNEQG